MPQIDRRSFLSGAALTLSYAAAGLGTAKAAPESYEQTIAKARGMLSGIIAEGQVPALTAALVSRKGPVWVESFGLLDKERNIAANQDTLFGIGSCSKMFAACAAMLLVERGLLDIDQPVVTYLPSFKMLSPEAARITPRMLLSHSSGFPGTDYRGGLRTAPFSGYVAQVLETLSAERLKHAPGELSVYCNDGFTMIEPIIAALSGKPYVDFVKAEILTPLGMARSRFALEPFAADAFAHGYMNGKNRTQEFLPFYATGGLYATAPEMARFLVMMLNDGKAEGQPFLTEASLAEMGRDQTRRQQIRVPDATDGYGLGWDGVRQPGFSAFGIPAWYKNGGTSIYSTEILVLPRQGLALFLSGSGLQWHSRKAVEEIMLAALVERGVLSLMPPAVQSGATIAARKLKGRREIAGTYGHYRGLLRIDAEPEGGFKLSKYQDGAWGTPTTGFELRARNALVRPTDPAQTFQLRDLGGIETLVAYLPYGYGHYELEFPLAQRMEPKTALSPAWQARVGREWLATNEPPDSAAYGLAPPMLKLQDVPGLPGYVTVTTADWEGFSSQVVDASRQDDCGFMCLKIPVSQSRDMNDLEIVVRNGEDWLRSGSAIYRPRETVPVLDKEWRKIEVESADMGSWFRSESALTAKAKGLTAWKVFDQELKLLSEGSSGQPDVPKGGYLLVFGTTGTPIEIAAA